MRWQSMSGRRRMVFDRKSFVHRWIRLFFCEVLQKRTKPDISGHWGNSDCQLPIADCEERAIRMSKSTWPGLNAWSQRTKKHTSSIYRAVWRGFCLDFPENWGFRKIRGFLWITFGDKSGLEKRVRG